MTLASFCRLVLLDRAGKQVSGAAYASSFTSSSVDVDLRKRIGQGIYGVDDDSIVVTPELTANDVDAWDSLGHMRLILAVESAFGMGFSAAEVKRLQNVGEFVALIQSKAAA